MSNDKTTEQPIPADFREWANRYADGNSIDAHPKIREHLNAELYEAAINTYRHLHSLTPSPVGEADAIAFAKWINNSWYTPHYAKWIHLREGLAGMKTAEELYAMFSADRPQIESVDIQYIETQRSGQANHVLPRWVETCKRQPPKDGTYHCRVDVNNPPPYPTLLKGTLEFENGQWKKAIDEHIIEWLDESPNPSRARETDPDFQSKVAEWVVACFGEAIAMNKVERNFRFLEEALELVQSNGCNKIDALALVDYVYSRPVGEIKEECGGVMVTLASLAKACEISMDECGDTELTRVWGKMEQIRAKQATKKIVAGPLP